MNADSLRRELMATDDEIKAPPILVPLDGSAQSEAALSHAALLARRLDAPLALIMIPLLYHYKTGSRRYVGGREPAPRVDNMDRLYAESVQAAEDYLGDQVNLLRGSGLRASSQVYEANPAEAIVGCADEIGAQLIVMSTHGHGGVKRWTLGSVADKVLQTARTPIFLLRGGAEAASDADHGIDHILVTLDGSGLAEEVLPRAEYLALSLGAKITLAHALVHLDAQPLLGLGHQVEAEALQREHACAYLESKAENLQAMGIDTETEILSGAGIAEAILERLEAGDVDLVAMTSHGRGGLRRWAFGSVADRLIRSAPRPVLILRNLDSEAEEG